MGLKPPIGTRLMLSTPAQMKASPAPSATAPAAMWTDCMEEPQKRLTVAPPTPSGSFASNPTRRGGVEALFALGEGAAEEQVLDVVRVHAAALHEGLDHLGGEVVGADAGERAPAGRLEGRSGIARDDGA